ncbi:unnamed protein product, partial [Polarella glacialis]
MISIRVRLHPAFVHASLNPQTGRTEDGDGLGLKGTGNIFANASAVLSMAAEDMEDHFDNMSLDDHMEKELANEVELWRMETSSAGAVQSDTGMHGMMSASFSSRQNSRCDARGSSGWL